MVKLREVRRVRMEQSEDAKISVPQCPVCGSTDLSRSDRSTDAHCHHCSWRGDARQVGHPRAVAMNDVYDLHRNSCYPAPEEESLSWPKRIAEFARALWKDPEKSLIVLLQHERSTRWRMEQKDGTPAMRITADVYLTNITQEDLFVLKTYFVPYACNGWFPSAPPVEGNALVKNHVMDEGPPGTHKIPPGFTYEGHADWWIHPPIKREGQTLTGRCCFVDQFDNEHWTAVITWKCR